MISLENFRLTETCLGHQCLTGHFSLPHPASEFNPMERRTVPVFFDVVKKNTKDTEIRIRFNRYEVGNTDIIACLKDITFRILMDNNRFLGWVPFVPTLFEQKLIEDRTHDEMYYEEENETDHEEE